MIWTGEAAFEARSNKGSTGVCSSEKVSDASVSSELQASVLRNLWFWHDGCLLYCVTGIIIVNSLLCFN
ncbi:hypothetical protein ACET3Z_030423 [Daucus carota]